MAQEKDEAMEATPLSNEEQRYAMEEARGAVEVIRPDREALTDGLRRVSAAQLSATLDGLNEADGESIVRVVARYMDLQRERHPEGQDDEALAGTLGYLYALGLARMLSWDMVVLTKSGRYPILGVSSPDRSSMGLPTVTINRLLRCPQEDNIIAATANYLAAGQEPPSAPQALVCVLS